mmetsp:Transcript_8520/g.26412  ORF Transcript_8520/g.26412 Transcript_8520/m.26412 type:complete len:287 (-) Transcript_8520:658-1518(-)
MRIRMPHPSFCRAPRPRRRPSTPGNVRVSFLFPVRPLPLPPPPPGQQHVPQRPPHVPPRRPPRHDRRQPASPAVQLHRELSDSVPRSRKQMWKRCVGTFSVWMWPLRLRPAPLLGRRPLRGATARRLLSTHAPRRRGGAMQTRHRHKPAAQHPPPRKPPSTDCWPTRPQNPGKRSAGPALAMQARIRTLAPSSDRTVSGQSSPGCTPKATTMICLSPRWPAAMRRVRVILPMAASLPSLPPRLWLDRCPPAVATPMPLASTRRRTRAPKPRHRGATRSSRRSRRRR